MGKEKVIGALILIVALLLLLYYTWGLVIIQLVPAAADWVNSVFPEGILRSIFNPNPMFLVILPIWAAVVLIGVIAMWIGYTMVTTPAPEPLEDFDFEEEKAGEEKKEEEKK